MEGVSQADLVIEAVPEHLPLKRHLFTQLDQLCSAHTILATNSSSIHVSRIEDATQRPRQVLNMHFYQPSRAPMVELMRGSSTSDQTMTVAYQFIQTLRLRPVMVHKESTGFIFNRIWHAIKRECLRIVADGIASHEDVDRMWMTIMGTARGPFASMDWVGLDVVRDIETVYYHESGNESDAPPQFLHDKIARGELGMKTGNGFYTYPNPRYLEPDWLRGE